MAWRCIGDRWVDGLEGLEGLEGWRDEWGLDGVEGLEGLDGLEGLALEGRPRGVALEGVMSLKRRSDGKGEWWGE